MATERKTYTGLLHAGAGTGLFLVQLSALIPGLLPTLALVGVLTVVLVLPLLVLGLVAALVAGPPYALWRLAGSGKLRRKRGPAPTVGACRRVRPPTTGRR